MLKENSMFFKQHSSVIVCLICSTVLSSPLVAVAATVADKKTSNVVTKRSPTKEGKQGNAALAAPSMMGATAPTDEHIDVRGHMRDIGDGVTGRAFGGGVDDPYRRT